MTVEEAEQMLTEWYEVTHDRITGCARPSPQE